MPLMVIAPQPSEQISPTAASRTRCRSIARISARKLVVAPTGGSYTRDHRVLVLTERAILSEALTILNHVSGYEGMASRARAAGRQAAPHHRRNGGRGREELPEGFRFVACFFGNDDSMNAYLVGIS